MNGKFLGVPGGQGGEGGVSDVPAFGGSIALNANVALSSIGVISQGINAVLGDSELGYLFLNGDNVHAGDCVVVLQRTDRFIGILEIQSVVVSIPKFQGIFVDEGINSTSEG